MHDSGTPYLHLKPWACGLILVLSCAVTLNGQGATSLKKMPRCLHGKQESSDFDISIHKAECNKDVLHLADEDSVRQAEGKLRLTQAHIEFIGCAPAPFSTSILNEQAPVSVSNSLSDR